MTYADNPNNTQPTEAEIEQCESIINAWFETPENEYATELILADLQESKIGYDYDPEFKDYTTEDWIEVWVDSTALSILYRPSSQPALKITRNCFKRALFNIFELE